MKNKLIKPLLVVLLTAVCLTSVIVPVAAAEVGAGAVVSNENTLSIPKGITMINDTTGTVQLYGTAITYDFTVAPVAPVTGAIVTDGTNSAVVQTGVANSVSVTTQPSFSADLVAMSATGIETTSDLVITVDVTAFTKPGVYRYEITDNTAISSLYSAGIVRSNDYQANRYLDVYIENDNGAFKVAGYVLMKNNPATNAGTGAQKSSGFIAADGAGNDSYTTYNVTLEKSITGAMADKAHNFPFAITVGNNGATYFWAKNDAVLANATSSATTALTSAALKNGDKIYIWGLNPYATVAYTETNDTDDIYVTTINGTNGALVAAAPVQSGAAASLAAANVSDYSTVNSSANVSGTVSKTAVENVVFVNNLDSVSPTGLVLRYAPSVIMLALAGALLLVFTRRKFAEENSRSI